MDEDKIFQLNGTSRQSTGVTFAAATNEFPAPPQIYGQSEPKPGEMIPTASPIRNQTLWTNTVTSNIANANPLTYRQINAAGSIPYGQARGQISLLTQLDINQPGTPLSINNSDVFRQVAFDHTGHAVKPSLYGKD